jgi:N-acetylglutamate synthase-like GNAT family acetyltransferase
VVIYAEKSDKADIQVFDKQISERMLTKAIIDKRVLIFKVSDVVMGMARWNFFWDSIPFLNMLYVPDGCTHHGIGSDLLKFWEREMQIQGYTRVFTSTMAQERGQHFLRRNGYSDIGNLYDEGVGLELILEKRFGKLVDRSR